MGRSCLVPSIIALLIGILLPAIGKARDKARTTTSVSNLRQLAAAQNAYTGDWEDAQLALCRFNVSAYGDMQGYNEAIFGCVLQAGLGQNPARQAALQAGLPETINAQTINKVCGSGLQRVMLDVLPTVPLNLGLRTSGGSATPRS